MRLDRRLLALLPAGFLALIVFWSGTFHGGASFSGAASAHAAVLGMALLARASWSDPLALGRAGRWLLLTFLVIALASWWGSPVERAGRVGIALLPAFMLLPSAVARCWAEDSQRHLGALSITVLAGGVATDALIRWWLLESPRAAMPLGHHNLLAGWLVVVTPLALLGLRQRGSRRWLSATAAVLIGTAVVASGSRVGVIALLAQAALAAGLWKRKALLVLGLPLLALLVQIDRLLPGVTALANALPIRASYLEAGWRGLLARPFLGWGPGSVAWLSARFHRPRPGLNPPGEVIGDLHSLPAQVAFELGAAGVVVLGATLVLFVLRRWRERELAPDRGLLLAGLISLAGAGVFCLANSQTTVLALAAAVAVVVGGIMAATRDGLRSAGSLKSWAAVGYVAAVGVALLPLEKAHYHYQRAVRETTPEPALNHLQRAVALDPEFPLYRARRAWLQVQHSGASPEAADEALRAATTANGVALLWLAAAELALEAKTPEAASALEHSCRLDPLSAIGPFLRLVNDPLDSRAVVWGARALLAEPRLLAAEFWLDHPDLRRRAIRRVQTWPGITDGFAATLAQAVSHEQPLSAKQPAMDLKLQMDATAHTSASLFAFRRSPWPTSVVAIALRPERLPDPPIVAASRRRTTASRAFDRGGCALDGSPDDIRHGDEKAAAP